MGGREKKKIKEIYINRKIIEIEREIQGLESRNIAFETRPKLVAPTSNSIEDTA